MLYRRFTIISLMLLGTALLAGSLLNEIYREKRSLSPFISASFSHDQPRTIDRNIIPPVSSSNSSFATKSGSTPEHMWGE